MNGAQSLPAHSLAISTRNNAIDPTMKNQHVAANDIAIYFGCLASLDNNDVRTFISTPTVGIAVAITGIAYSSVLTNANCQKCVITCFTQPEIAVKATLE